MSILYSPRDRICYTHKETGLRYWQEINGEGHHRLVRENKDGTLTHTNLVSYREPAYLDGIIGHTAYYGVSENILPADEFCRSVWADLSSYEVPADPYEGYTVEYQSAD